MTTTLRPTGPIEEGADGARIRAYEVCDNGRPVGAVVVGTDADFGARTGVIHSLRIEEDRRRRGRGAIAALAAEEVLRGWGCTSVRAEVPAGSAAGRGLAAMLGFTERGRTLVKETGPRDAELPAGVTGRPMTEDEFVPWLAGRRQEYAQEWIDRGVPADQARQKSEKTHDALLPQGPTTEGAHIHQLVAPGPDGGEEVLGHVWVARRDQDDGLPSGYVYYVEVAERHRGRGHGRALMLLAENLGRLDGLERMGLHVFTTNTTARRLYESLGYLPHSHHLVKDL
ncbi:N-acetyltransferase [uncultured Streptomyces sp.]|uniref:GNAT family N-acetyltransferase n=1 Tax=uncultured Streptomyces sp. TaxID=174707 RepID=UPI00262075A7|nr:GNAT family N-acetyltransferase [uncultured Streptomyces sp.]